MTLASPIARFLFVVTVIGEWLYIAFAQLPSTRINSFTAKASSHVAYSTQNWNLLRVINSTF